MYFNPNPQDSLNLNEVVKITKRAYALVSKTSI